MSGLIGGLDWVFDGGLALLLAAVAWWAVHARHLFTGAIFYVVYGLLMAVAWVRLGAPNVALAEAAIGAGVTGVLLMGALARLSEPREGDRERED